MTALPTLPTPGAPGGKPSSLAALLEVLKRLDRRGLYYCRKRIQLDGLTFEECAFENCELFTTTGEFVLRRCRIYGPETVFVYDGPALRVARLFELMHASILGRALFPNFYPQTDPDGRISIG